MSAAPDLQSAEQRSRRGRRETLALRLAEMARELMALGRNSDVASADAVLNMGMAAGRLDYAAEPLRAPVGRSAAPEEALASLRPCGSA